MKFKLSDHEIDFIAIAAKNGTVLTEDIESLCEFSKGARKVIEHLMEQSDQAALLFMAAMGEFLDDLIESMTEEDEKIALANVRKKVHETRADLNEALEGN